jgi:hypothetical protein
MTHARAQFYAFFFSSYFGPTGDQGHVGVRT